MSFPQFDRNKLLFRPLKERRNQVFIETDHVHPDSLPKPLPAETREKIASAAEAIRTARSRRAAVVLAFGAHTIKNGLSPLLIRLIEEGWVTHLATNGAGIIHDWEFAYQGASSEDVRENMASGQFGLWEETGFYLNLALTVGAFAGLGYGESAGSLVHQDGLAIPAAGELLALVREKAAEEPQTAAAAADLLAVIMDFRLQPGFLSVSHPYKRFGLQAAAFRLKVPFTGHPMFGQDIVYAHPMNRGAAVGRTAERDFLSFARSISDLEHGVYFSIGSAVMSPMIFEKSFSMARNVALREGRHIDSHQIFIVDLEPMEWDWQAQGEPPPDHPAYYLRYCKTFSRVGGSVTYVNADNRNFLLALYGELKRRQG